MFIIVSSPLYFLWLCDDNIICAIREYMLIHMQMEKHSCEESCGESLWEFWKALGIFFF